MIEEEKEEKEEEAPEEELPQFALFGRVEPYVPQKIVREPWEVIKPPYHIPPGDFQTICVTANLCWQLNKRIPTYADVAEYVKRIAIPQIQEIMATEQFQSAMQIKGVPLTDDEGLSALQMQVLVEVSNPSSSRGKLETRLKRMGVSYVTYMNWKADPLFARKLREMTKDILTEHRESINVQLTSMALDGKLEAIKYLNELTGEHDPNRVKAVNLEKVLEAIYNAIIENVKDPIVVKKILVAIQASAPPPKEIISGY